MPVVGTKGAMSSQGFGEFAQSGAVNYIEDVFSTYLYTGNGSTQTITNNIDLSTKGGLVWLKSRSAATNSFLFDTVRGALNEINSNTDDAQASLAASLTAFNTTGFSLGAAAGINVNAATYVSWTFREQPKFFDVVTYTGTGAALSVAHNLGSVPGCIIVKRTDTTGAWQVYHRSLANTEYLVLNTDAAKATGTTRWNSTTPTSTVFSLGTDATVNASGGSYVAYLFAHEAGGFGLTGTESVISCGSFTSNVSGNGATITLPWEPQFLITKNTQSAHDWKTVDVTRLWSQTGYVYVYPNAPDSEYTTTQTAALSPSGVVYPSGGFINNNTHVYIAIRRGPMKVPTSGTSVLGISARTGTGANATVTNGSSVTDLAIIKNRGTFDPNLYTARLIGPSYTSVSDTMVEASAGATILQSNPWDVMSGIKVGTTSTLTNASSNTFINYLFTRAPTVFDIVCFKGTSAALTVTHNLGAVPQFIITINRSAAANCLTYNPTSGATKYLPLNSDQANLTNSGAWNNTAPTSSVFTVGSFFNAQNYIAFLFATLAGVSKVGTYTGNGSTQTIDCGFGAGGARFVLLKRTDAAGDWYVYDTARGMTTLTDPYFLMDTNAGDVATLGSVTTVSTGFALNSSILAAINVNTGTYIFLAIA